MLKVSVSILEEYRKLRDFDTYFDQYVQNDTKFLDKVNKKPGKKRPYADLGVGFHEVLENPDECYDRFAHYYRKSGFRTSNNIDFPYEMVIKCLEYVNRDALKEVEYEKIYNVDGTDIIVTGRVDAINGIIIDDYKSTWGTIHLDKSGEIEINSGFDIERYFKTCQWKFYLDIFECEVFNFKIFDLLINRTTEGSIELNDIHEIQFLWSSDINKYLETLLYDFLSYIKFRKIENLFLEQSDSDSNIPESKEKNVMSDEINFFDTLAGNESDLNSKTTEENNVDTGLNFFDNPVISESNNIQDDLVDIARHGLGLEHPAPGEVIKPKYADYEDLTQSEFPTNSNESANNMQLVGRCVRPIDSTDSQVLPKSELTLENKDISGAKIYHLEIKNFMGIESLDIQPGKGMFIRAKNGTGKTSVIKAIKTAISGGSYDAELIRLGTKEAQIGIELTDGTKINKRITPEKQTLTVTQHGKKITKQQGFLNDLFDEFGTNPLELLIEDSKKRVDVLLEALKLRVSEEEIKETLQGEDFELTYDVNDHALSVLDDIKKQIEASKKSIKTILDIKEKSYHNTQMNIMEIEGDPKELESTISTYEAEKSKLENTRNKYISDINDKKDAGVQRLRDNHAIEIQSIRDRYEKELAEAKLRHDSEIENERNTHEENKAKMQAQYELKYNPIIEKLQTSKTALQNLSAVMAMHAQLKKDASEIEELKSTVESRNELKSRFEKLRNEIKNRIPIPGLEIIENKIYKDGVEFEKLNTAEQMKLCIKIGSLHNSSGLMLVDGIERLDSANQDLLINLATESGLQLIVTEVSEDNYLNITKI